MENLEKEVTSLKILRRRCEVLSLLLKTMPQCCVFGCQHCSFAASFAALFAAPRFAPNGISTPSDAAMICFCVSFQVSSVARACLCGGIVFCHVPNFRDLCL